MASRSHFNRVALLALPLGLLAVLALMQSQKWLRAFSMRTTTTAVTSSQPDSAPCNLYGGLPDRGNSDRVPAFLIVGAQKAGTTFLHSILKTVPGISQPITQPAMDDNDLPPVYSGITKELHFWDRAHLQRDSFLKGYLPAWAGANASDMLFESSPGYLPTPMAPIRISKMLPDVKIVVLLREPSSRALSHWNMRQTFCKREDKQIICPLNFEAAVQREITALKTAGCGFGNKEAYNNPFRWNKCFRCYFEASCDFTEGAMTEPWFHLRVDSNGPKGECKQWSQYSGYVFRGMYAAQLGLWSQYFSPSQLHIINQDDLQRTPHAVLAGVLSFLGVQHDDSMIAKLLNKKSGFFRGSYKKNGNLDGPGRISVMKTLDKLQEFYAFHNEQLYKLLDKMGVQNFSKFDTEKVKVILEEMTSTQLGNGM